jgi:hypothetical protein
VAKTRGAALASPQPLRAAHIFIGPRQRPEAASSGPNSKAPGSAGGSVTCLDIHAAEE